MTTREQLRAGFTHGLSQWPLIAAAWAFHGGLLLYVFFSRFTAETFPLSERTLAPAGLLGLMAIEVGFVTLLLALPEALRPRGKAALALDLAKSVGLSLAVATLVASTLKFLATSVHLKVSDLWFAWANAPQILQEAQPAELLSLVALPVGTAVLSGLLLLGFRRWRKGSVQIRPRTFGLVMAGCALLVIAANTFSVTLPQVLSGIVPEGHWVVLRRSHSRFLVASDSLLPVSPSARTITTYSPGRPEKPLNVVLVMLESVPWKRTWLNDPERAGVAPHLERLAEESVVFDRAYAASTHSDYAQMAILSSLHPRKYDRHDYYIDIQYPRALIWDALEPAGYTTALFSCQNEQWGNMRNYLETPGLDVFRHSLNWPRAPHRGSGIESKVYEPTPVAEWQSWRRKRARAPYFVYLNFQSNHFPYDVPPGAPRPYLPDEMDFASTFLSYPEEKVPVMLNRFDNAFRYADHHVGEVISFLQEVGDWDSTVLIVVSDHGEAFYEHGQPTHGTALYEEQVRSFLMIRAPELEPRRIDQPVSLLDVAPTLLEILELPSHGNFQGRGDILDPTYDGSRRPFFFTIQALALEDGVLLGDNKLIVNFDHQTKKLFDLGSDPEELNDLATVRPDKLQAMEQVMAAFLRQQLGYYERELWLQGIYPVALP